MQLPCYAETCNQFKIEYTKINNGEYKYVWAIFYIATFSF